MKSVTLSLLLLFSATTFFAQEDPPTRVARLGYMSGSVSFQPAGMQDWVPASPNRPMTTGDQLWVDEGRAEMHVGSAAFRLGPQTAFQFLNLNDETTQIRLSAGSVNVRIRYIEQDQTFEVDTPNIAFSLLRPGDYRVDVQPDSQTTIVTVRDGQAEGTGGGQAFNLRAGEQASVTGDQSINYDVYTAPEPDGWDNWCMQRDRRAEHSQALRYVPREMTGYSDLDDHGDWRGSPYGEVWVPRDVAPGWAPYHNGHWAWIDPWGYTWVDDAPWGFAPFHYGRWAYYDNQWAWVPGPMASRPVYAPAMVAWIGGAHFGVSISLGAEAVGWVALGPREAYVPPYNVSPTYINRVNTSNTVINNVNITNIHNTTNITTVNYVNARAPNAVVAVPAQAMASARPVNQVSKPVSAAAFASAQVIRSAPVAPQSAAVMGRSAPSAVVARPPAAVMSRAVVSKAPAPPPPVPFAAMEQARQRSPGVPLTHQETQQVRQSAPAPRQAVVVRQAPPAARVVQPTVAPHPPQNAMQARPVGAPPAGTATPAQANRPPDRPLTPQQAQPASHPQSPAQPLQPAYHPPAAAQPAQPAYHPPSPAQPAQPVYRPPSPAQPAKEPATGPAYREAPAAGGRDNRQAVEPAYKPPAPAKPAPVQPAYQPPPAPRENQPSYRPPPAPNRPAVEPVHPPADRPVVQPHPAERPAVEPVHPPAPPPEARPATPPPHEKKAPPPPKEEDKKKEEK